MFGTIILITWVIGLCLIVNDITNAPELDEYEKPVNKKKVG